MRAATDAKYSLAPGVVIAQPRLILAVDLEFPKTFPDIAFPDIAFPDIAGGECLAQTEAEYNGSNCKQPWIDRHGEPRRVFRDHPSARFRMSAIGPELAFPWFSRVARPQSAKI
jgi:hypothetical protein